MKSFLLALAIVSAFLKANAASTDVRVFQAKNMVFDPAHAANVTSATVTVDYAAQKVKLEAIKAGSPCPAGSFCILSVPAPLVVELPITSVEQDSCGIHHIVASKDDRPADGTLQELKVEDVQDMSCQTFAAVVAHASYRTVAMDQMSGKEVEVTSTMELEPQAAMDPSTPPTTDPTPANYEFVSGYLFSGFKPSANVQDGTLQITKDSVIMTVTTGPSCAANTVCPKYASQPISVTLPIVKRATSYCGERIYARSKTADSTTVMDIVDYKSGKCRMPTKYSLKVVYGKIDKKARPRNQSALLFFEQK